MTLRSLAEEPRSKFASSLAEQQKNTLVHLVEYISYKTFYLKKLNMLCICNYQEIFNIIH